MTPTETSYALAVCITTLALGACEPTPDPVVPTAPTGTEHAPTASPSASATAQHVDPKPVPVPTLASTPEDELFPTVSTSGRLAFQREVLGGDAEAVVLSATVGAELGPATQLSPEGKAGQQPALSPDGTTLVFVSNALGPLALLKRAPDPTSPISVLVSSDKAPEPGEPAFSADGKQIAFTMRGPDGARTIAMIQIDGSKLTPLFAGRSPSFRPDGGAVAFIASVDGFNHVFVRELGGAKTQRAVTSGRFDCDHPTWSPDGRQLAFASNRGFEEARAPRETFLRIFAIDADGSNARALTPAGARAATPAWAADGTLYFSVSSGGSFDLARLDPRATSGS